MKKVHLKWRDVAAIVACLAVVIMATCNSGESKQSGSETAGTKTEQAKSGAGVTASTFVGIWTDAMKTIAFEFKAGGTGVIKYHQAADKKDEAFTWKVDGNKVSLDIEGGDFDQFEYVGDNKLEDMMGRPFTRQ